ncbi:hypothetical protein RHGRI_030048 [Rhododendron griersonianum]|uniref:Uncharacterized protein n=1 Tax=Rhododendron griersonianum TaxID=479676 RepID=A0AAV6IMI6_9ERIC|nr:hypothetical protein RHGRI_030048 [Rhododendron griersonianum]
MGMKCDPNCDPNATSVHRLSPVSETVSGGDIFGYGDVYAMVTISRKVFRYGAAARFAARLRAELGFEDFVSCQRIYGRHHSYYYGYVGASNSRSQLGNLIGPSNQWTGPIK